MKKGYFCKRNGGVKRKDGTFQPVPTVTMILEREAWRKLNK